MFFRLVVLLPLLSAAGLLAASSLAVPPDELEPPVFVSPEPRRLLRVSRCDDSAVFIFKAIIPNQPQAQGRVRYRLIDGCGRINEKTGRWVWYPAPEDTARIRRVVVGACINNQDIETLPENRAHLSVLYRDEHARLIWMLGGDTMHAQTPVIAADAPGTTAVTYRISEPDWCDEPAVALRMIDPAPAGKIFFTDSTLTAELAATDAGQRFVVTYGLTSGQFSHEGQVIIDTRRHVVPVFVECPSETLSVAVCATLSCRLRAIDPDFPDDPTGIFYRIAPMPYYPGSVQGSTGEYRFRGRPEDAGQVFEIGVAAHYGDTMTTGDQICRFWVRVDENQPPLFTGSLCHTLVNAPPGSPPFFEMQVEAVDPEECGPVALFVAGVSPLPVGGFTFDPEDGSFTMPLAPAELEETFTIRIGAADAVDTAYCEFDYRHLNRDPVAVMIERIGGDTPGGRHALDLTVTQNNLELQGFDLTIGFEAAALNLQGVSPGSVYDSCGWEYFTYRYGAGGACPECPSGILRLVGLAETNNGEAHPSCFRPAAPFSLATLEFLESAEPAWAGVFVPVRFLWLDCTANALAARLIAEIPEYTDLLISREVYDLDSVLAEDGEVYSFLAITDPLGTFPATGGAVGDCDAAAMPHPAPIRRVDFFNGGVKIAGPPATPVGEHNPDGTAGGPPLPSTFAVHQNCPNPFNLETVIPFDLPRQGRVTLEIYNTLGRRVYRQVGDYPAGYHRLVWDGRTDGGRVAASGVYVYRLATGETAAARKMMLLK